MHQVTIDFFEIRHHKFRIWDVVNKVMIRNPNLIIEDGVLKTDREKIIVMQCTGRKDGKKNDIYEGDVIRLEYYPDLPTTKGIELIKFLRVQYYINHTHYSAVDENGHSYSVGFGGSAVKSYEIVGNIYENPEYLRK